MSLFIFLPHPLILVSVCSLQTPSRTQSLHAAYINNTKLFLSGLPPRVLLQTFHPGLSTPLYTPGKALNMKYTCSKSANSELLYTLQNYIPTYYLHLRKVAACKGIASAGRPLPASSGKAQPTPNRKRVRPV